MPRCAWPTLLSGDSAAAHPVLARLTIELALAENRIDDARRLVDASLPPVVAAAACDMWPLLCTAARVATHLRLAAKTGAPASSTGAPASGTGASASAGPAAHIRDAASRLPTDTPAYATYAAQVAAERDGSAGAWNRVAGGWEALGQAYLASCARLRAADAHLRGGDRDTARALLLTAAGHARRLGAKPLLEDVQALARGARIALDRPEGTPEEASGAARFGLTEREAEVLRLVTEGRSNRQIGEELFISPKTVSLHVSHILSQLGVASRGEAAATAHRLRLFPPAPKG